MRFIYQQVSLEYQEDKGYRHPQSGQWVATPRDCLAGWLEEDPERRKQWVMLTAHIQEFWPRVEKNKLAVGEEVVFG